MRWSIKARSIGSWNEKGSRMKERSILIILGFAIYIVMSAIDKFVFTVPDAVYISLGILSIVLVVVGAFKSKKRK